MWIPVCVKKRRQENARASAPLEIGVEALAFKGVYQNEVPPPNLNCWTVSYFPLVSGIA
jgi:hypothetical protein